MKREEIKDWYDLAVANMLVNSYEKADELKRNGIKPSVARGVAYGLSIGSAMVEKDKEPGFGPADFAAIITYTRDLERIAAKGGALDILSKMFGCKVADIHTSKGEMYVG